VRMIYRSFAINLRASRIQKFFLGGPSGKSVLTEYGGHTTRCIYENFVSYLIV
jgi:hypothetical protein